MKTLVRKPKEKAAEVARRDPFFNFAEWPELGHLFGRPAWPLSLVKDRDFCPPMDVFKHEGFLFLELDLPGMVKKDIQVTVEGPELIIEGERKEEKTVDKDNFFKVERSIGTFYRRVALGFEVKPKEVKAEFKNGVLKIRVPFLAEEKEVARNVPIV